ncbi:hypothetical protein [Algibacter lectus]|uniref:DinB-like domain-containing protein n=1 Tax=Algibacter lectus TaxID=221126 RepID=A0A090VEF8_9FLAO|nr:hypothetical protein [Algibacter lectus]GAL63136.1 hypothetical protein JCM19300_1158 [Algibacter lectus]
MDIIIASSLKTLQKAELLLHNLCDANLCDASVAPYYSSIGSHIRHILDFYNCIFNMNENLEVDLTARCRNTDVENQCHAALNYLNITKEKLQSLDIDVNSKITVIDDLAWVKPKWLIRMPLYYPRPIAIPSIITPL